MKRFLSSFQLSALIFVSACGLVRESEVAIPPEKAALPGTECEIKKDNFTDVSEIQKVHVLEAADCIEKRLEGAFSQIKGAQKDELSVDELRTLQKQHLFELPQTPMPESLLWDIVGKSLRLIHPDGKPALSLLALRRTLNLVRKNIDDLFLIRDAYFLTDKPESSEDNLKKNHYFIQQAIRVLRDISDLISPKFRLSLNESRTLMQQISDFEVSRKHFFPEETPENFKKSNLENLKAFWILKSFLVPDDENQGLDGDINGNQIRDLIDLGLRMTEHSFNSFVWGKERLSPGALPAELGDGAEKVAGIFIEFIRSHRFTAIDSDSFAWAMKRLSSRGGITELAPDLVRLSQRLCPNHRHDGLHPDSLIPFLKETRSLFTDIFKAKERFSNGNKTRYGQPALDQRELISDPILIHVAGKGRSATEYRYRDSNGNPVQHQFKNVKSKDGTVTWHQALGSLAKRAVVKVVFGAFDLDGDGKLPLVGETSDELEETLDLAYTLVRFIALASMKEDEKKKEELVPNFIAIRPSALHQIIGLVGDELFPDSDRNGSLDFNELHSIVEIQEEIQSRLKYQGPGARYISPDRVTFKGESYFRYAHQDVLYPRTSFVEHLASVQNYYLEYSDLILKELTVPERASFFHGLVDKPKRKPVEALDLSTKEMVQLSNYVHGSASLPAGAILVAIEKLMILCDGKNSDGTWNFSKEDNVLDWEEMDCALPIALRAGLQVIESSLVDLDPGTNDMARFLLRFLQAPGIPLSLSKILVSQGGLSRFNLASLAVPAAKGLLFADTLDISFEDLGKMISHFDRQNDEEVNWAERARTEFGECDRTPKDGRLKGRTEMDCYVDRMVRQIERWMGQAVPEPILKLGLDKLLPSQDTSYFRLALILAPQSSAKLARILGLTQFKASPQKILLTLEDLLKRDEPLLPETEPVVLGRWLK